MRRPPRAVVRRLLLASSAAACGFLPACTGDPTAPDIWNYRRRHQRRMADGDR